jgi:hypothetical protein
MTGMKIAIWFLVSILVIRIVHNLWQKVCVIRTGQRFQFLLTGLRFEQEITWRDVRYSFLVVFDSAVFVFILVWLTGFLS